jgi:hypothetical protein
LAVDFPVNEHQKLGNDLIKLHNFSDYNFRSIELIVRESNYGVYRNAVELKKYVFKSHSSLIFFEDDNVVAEDFLIFNKACEAEFSNNPNVFSICSYHRPYNIKSNNNETYYISNLFSGWGFLLWRDKYFDFLKSVPDTINFSLSIRGFLQLLIENPTFLQTYYSLTKPKEIVYNDMLINIYLIQHGMIVVTPTKTRVLNFGHDGSGENCDNNSDVRFKNQVFDIDNMALLDLNTSLLVSKYAREGYDNLFRLNTWVYIKVILRYIYCKIIFLNR